MERTRRRTGPPRRRPHLLPARQHCLAARRPRHHRARRRCRARKRQVVRLRCRRNCLAARRHCPAGSGPTSVLLIASSSVHLIAIAVGLNFEVWSEENLIRSTHFYSIVSTFRAVVGSGGWQRCCTGRYPRRYPRRGLRYGPRWRGQRRWRPSILFVCLGRSRLSRLGCEHTRNHPLPLCWCE